MKLQNKPGDISVVISGSEQGTLVEVMYAAPVWCFYNLPDGQDAMPTEPGVWVIRILGKTVKARMSAGGTRDALYGACKDSKIRPLRDPDAALAETEAHEIPA